MVIGQGHDIYKYQAHIRLLEYYKTFEHLTQKFTGGNIRLKSTGYAAKHSARKALKVRDINYTWIFF